MTSLKRWEVHTLSTDFRKAAHLIVEKTPELRARQDHVIVENSFVGINATDIHITSGAYAEHPPPFGCGLEGVGIIREVGAGVQGVAAGDAVAYRHLGAFANFVEVPSEALVPCEAPTAAMLPLMVGGVSASIALEEVGQMKSGETILVTSAAGGTGQFAVQLAKLAGNHVIGTCSSDEKVKFLKSIGCNRAINYMKEDLGEVLEKEYPNGVDLVFETVGGNMFKTALEHLAVHGRLIVFGYISGYQQGGMDKGCHPMSMSDVAPLLLRKSQSIRGFLLSNHQDKIHMHMKRLVHLMHDKRMESGLDGHVFCGLESIPDAIDVMYAHKNTGKLVVAIQD